MQVHHNFLRSITMKVDATTKTGKEEEGCCGAKRKTRKHL